MARRRKNESTPPAPPASNPTLARKSRAKFTFVIVAALLLLFAALAWFAALSKSPAYDEPLHAVSAWLQVHEGDFRVDPEDPPLWKYFAGLASRRDDIRANLKLPPGTTLPVAPSPAEPVTLDSHDPLTPAIRYALVPTDIFHEWPVVVDLLYPCGRTLPLDSGQCPDSDAFIMRLRGMMLILGVALGVVIALWGWQLGGSITAIVAACLFALDPNFLGHAPLVKNDVPITLITVALFCAVWRAGCRLTVWNLLAIALLCAAAVTTKYSGLLLGPIVALLMLGRALMPEPWVTFWRTLDLRTERLAITLITLAAVFVVCYAGIWAAYGFRFGPSTDPSISLNLKQMGVYTAIAELSMQNNGEFPTQEQIDAWRPSNMTRVIFVLDETRALPQAWLSGLLYTYQSQLTRETFLMGEYSALGWWYYFPMAMLFKTPTGTLVAAAAAIGVFIALVKALGWRAMATWTAACLFIPPAMFLAFAMRSNLNLGLRHILPVYPFLYLGIALAAGEAWRRWPRAAKVSVGALALLLAVEAFSAFPNFIAFFNAPSGGSRGGLKRLGDSNLDWGQDLKLLAQWKQDRAKTHPNEPFYLVYFGLADPWAYGIDYVNLPGGYKFGPKYEVRSDPGIVAISATALQGIYMGSEKDPGWREDYARLRAQKPIEVLGGTIYLYRWPPPARGAQ